MFPLIKSPNKKYNQFCPSLASLSNRNSISPISRIKKNTSHQKQAHGNLKSRLQYMCVEASGRKKKYTDSCKENTLNELQHKKKRRKSSMKQINFPKNSLDLFGKLNMEDYCQTSSIRFKKIRTQFQPPHRYKTCIAVYKKYLILYGGLGCEKALSWAKLNFDTLDWQFASKKQENKIFQYHPPAPIYGHTMVRCKDKAIIYGGISADQLNQVTVIKTDKLHLYQGERAPFRRRDHATTIFGDLMIVHGGIQNRKTKSDTFIYDVLLNKWIIANCVNSPALSHHKMAVVDIKIKGLSGTKQIYMFGGINDKGKSTNNLYKLKISDQNEIKFEQIIDFESEFPHPRNSFCLQPFSTNQMILYGGKEDNQSTDADKKLQKGVFGDIYIYNVLKKMWKQVQLGTQIDHRFGMGSTSLNGFIFIFGGSSAEKYADGTIFVIWKGPQNSQPLQNIQKATLKQINSSKKVTAKCIQ